MGKRKLELLSPASNVAVAIEAIKHGADAVYIGPPSFGARKSASNSIEDIEKVVDFAHQYHAKVYATVNTIVFDSEIKTVESLCRDLYHVGVDALIVQDMGILRMNIPPIQLHASTQCDIRTPEKALFLQEVGFSQLVLARELTLEEIKAITDVVNVPVEVFVHGALCVSYSGRCHASHAITGRSANRGECAQICRLPYTLQDREGKILSKNKYLLSLKDFNASDNLEDLIKVGVSSFKIEGRLKDASYVKNITSFYNNKINHFINQNTEEYERSSYGEVKLKFVPQAEKSFNRGFTNYFLTNRKNLKIASLITPKSQGEKITDINDLHNGDGISFIDKEGNFSGVNINKVEGGKIIPARRIEIPHTSPLFRTMDVNWEKIMRSETAERRIGIDLTLNDKSILAKDNRGVEVRLPIDYKYEPARQKQEFRLFFDKLGNTIYKLAEFKNLQSEERFYKASELTTLKREIVEWLNKTNKATYPYQYRLQEKKEVKFPVNSLDYRDNVANKLAEEFYRDHGVKKIERATEAGRRLKSEDTIMTTRHCVLRELGMCLKEKGKKVRTFFPYYITFDGGKFKLDFDCEKCEMMVKLP